MKKVKKVSEVREIKPLAIASILEKHGDFELHYKAKTVTYLTIEGKKVVLSHWHESLKLPNGSMIEPATQEQLKAIFDESPNYKTLIKAPSSYKARWDVFQK